MSFLLPNKVDTGKMIVAPWEMYSTDLSEARSDHACSLVQHGWRRGILVAGGYRTDGAWMSTVEFVDLEQGESIPRKMSTATISFT